MRYLSAMLVLLLVLNQQIGFSFASQTPREIVLEIFRNSIDLNENFKAVVKAQPLEKQKEKRKILEQYQEKELSFGLENCVILLSSGNDTELANVFFDLLSSFENSADEALANAFGEIYLNNPDLILKTFENFDKQKQKYLYGFLEWGFKNIVAQRNISEAEIEQYLSKLKTLQTRLFTVDNSSL